MLAAKGWPLIFIGFSGASNLILPASIADWISLQNTIHSQILCEIALCHLQYLWFFNSAVDKIVWFTDSLICPYWRNRSKILSAFVTSNPYFSFFLFSKWARDWLSLLGPLGQDNLRFLIGVGRIPRKIYLFLEQSSSWNRGLNVNTCLPLRKMA